MYTKIFQSGRIGNLDIKNRIVMTAAGLTYANTDGEANDRVFAYIEERAKGGAGIIMPGTALVDSKTGMSHANELILEHLGHVKSLAILARIVHKYDAKLFLQLYHPGKTTTDEKLGGIAPWSASPVKTSNGKPAKEMTKEDIDYIIGRFVHAAKLAKLAGVDGVEIHAAHGYLLNQFLSPHFNRRTDEYGGDLNNRMRIVVQIYEAIRREVGERYVVGIRVSADEFIEGGNTLQEGIQMCKKWDEIGLDYINVNCAIQETAQFNREPPSFQQGWKKHLSASVKEAVSCPVIAVNTVKKPDFAERLLAEDVCDYVGLSRAHISDPHWLKKTASGKEDEIRVCISCLNCMQTLLEGTPPTCTVNPAVGREREFSSILKNGDDRPVAVIGGGPAGMQAALILAKRGFAVTLFEREDTLGGQLKYAEKPPHKEKIQWYKENLHNEVVRSGAEIRYGSDASVDEIRNLNPVGVFAACGSQPIVPAKIPGIDKHHVKTAVDVLSGAEVRGQDIVVVGGGMVGLETAEYLGERGFQVTILEMMDTVGAGMFLHVLNDTLDALKQFDTTILTKHALRSIEDNTVRVLDHTGKEIEIQADSVVLAIGTRPDTQKVNELKAAFEKVIVVGDAGKSGKILDAMSDGFTKAWVFDVD